MKSIKLTQEELFSNVIYDKKTGIFIWIAIKPRVVIGSIAGSKDEEGYIIIKINQKTYKAHRLAWFYVYGYMPENIIDHKDQIRHHNWINNLREVSQSCNMQNTKNPKNNTSGVKGVCWDAGSNAWVSSLFMNKKRTYLGQSKDFDEAVCLRLAGEQCLNWDNCNSNSPAYEYVQKMLNRGGM